METLTNWFDKALDWLLDVLLYIPKKIYEWLLDSFAWIIENIPVPDFFTSMAGAFANTPLGVVYFLDIFLINEGLAIVLAAYLLRFIIRRIPFIG